MSRPQAQLESTSGGFLDEIVTFVVNVVEVARGWIVSIWYPSALNSVESKQLSVAPPQRDISSTTPNFVSGPVEESTDIGRLGNTEDSSVLPPVATDSAVQSQENQPSYPLTSDTNAAEVAESRDEVPLVRDQDLGQAESTAAIHEIPVANDSSQEWISVSKPDAESLSSTRANDVQPEIPTAPFVPPQHEEPQAEGSSTLESSTLVDAPIELHDSAMTIGSDTSLPVLSTPEPDNRSFDAVRIQMDGEKQVPEATTEVGSVSELKTRTSIPSLNDSASGSIDSSGTAGAGTSEAPTKKKRGGSFIRKPTTLMNQVFKSKLGSSDNGNGKDGPSKLTSPSTGSLTIDNQSKAPSFVSEPETMEQSIPAPEVSSADTPKLTSSSRVSLRSISSIKKKFGRRSSTASDKDVVPAVTVPDQESRSESPEPLNLPSNSSQPSKVADATGPSLLKTMFKVRKPSKIDEPRA